MQYVAGAFYSTRPRRIYTRHVGFFAGSDRFDRSIRVNIWDYDNPETDFQVGRIMVDDAYSPSRNYAPGARHTQFTKNVSQKIESGTENRRVHSVRCGFSGELQLADEEEVFSILWDLQERAGTGKDVIVIPNSESPAAHAQAAHGYFRGLQPMVNDNANFFRVRLDIGGL
jgi:hypothetical protein